MDAKAWAGLIHPAIAVVFVFPLIGIVAHYAWQTRQRRLQVAAGNKKSVIPPTSGREHVRLGRWLTGSVVGVSLLAIDYSIAFKGWPAAASQQAFIAVMFALTLASLVFLYRAQQPRWRGIFAALSSTGLIVLGCQEGVFRRTNEWYISHYYFGITASVLMIISLASVPEIYQDRSLTWRRVHIALNTVALLLFFGQGLTGARDLFEIGLYTPPPT